MKISVFADDLYPGFGGQAVATENHIEALARLGHQVRVLAGAEKKPTSAPSGVELERLPTWQLGEIQTSFALPQITKLRWLLQGADVLQVNTPTPLGWLLMFMARRRNIPVVVGLHTQEESATMHFKPPFATMVGFFLHKWYTFFYAQADVMTAPTPFAVQIGNNYTRKPCCVVSNGIDFKKIRELGQQPVFNARQEWLAGKQFLLSYVGRLAPEKSPQSLIEIMLQLVKLRQDVRLVIAGRGPLLQTLKNHCQSQGLDHHVAFLGFVSEADKQLFLQASDIFVMPSPTELQSIATLEAMAQECMIVAAQIDTSAVVEMVKAANCGLGYDFGQPAQAAAIIDQVLSDQNQLEEYQKNALSCAKTHDLIDSGRALERIYQTLVAVKNLN